MKILRYLLKNIKCRIWSQEMRYNSMDIKISKLNKACIYDIKRDISFQSNIWIDI